jgi:hypothetical protein
MKKLKTAKEHKKRLRINNNMKRIINTEIMVHFQNINLFDIILNMFSLMHLIFVRNRAKLYHLIVFKKYNKRIYWQ